MAWLGLAGGWPGIRRGCCHARRVSGVPVIHGVVRDALISRPQSYSISSRVLRNAGFFGIPLYVPSLVV